MSSAADGASPDASRGMPFLTADEIAELVSHLDNDEIESEHGTDDFSEAETPIGRALLGPLPLPEDDDDDDDMEYEPSTDDFSEAEIPIGRALLGALTEDEDYDDENNIDYQDAEEGQVEFSVDVENQPEDQDDDTDIGEAGGPLNQRTISVTGEQILQLLGNHPRIGRLLRGFSTQPRRPLGDSDDDEDEDDDSATLRGFGGDRRRSRKKPKTPIEERYPPVPNPAGVELMSSGTFGSNDPRQGYAINQKKGVAMSILGRELGHMEGPKSIPDPRYMSQDMIPSSSPDTIINHDARCYSGQFSDDGNFFFSCSQDFQVRMYDTSNPYQWRYYKKVRYPSGRWTITDASLSPDNKYLAYSSITSVVCLAPTDPGVDTEPWMLDFSIRGTGGRNSQAFGYNSLFGIWSIRFSGDGKEIVAGTTDNSVYVYDLETRQSILEIPGHDDDVNAVCFGDKSSPHILYSGSDDATLKVWDRRSMGDGREAGVFIGHTEGLTYIDSKGDGRYVLSNSKDQTMKLWDLRKMVTAEKFDQLDSSYRRGIKDFDYRNDSYYEDEYVPDPNDCSVVTFRGHRVLKTLIRCHFSPPGSTNSRYVYTGSRDGIVYIYNLDGTLAGKVNVNDATRGTRPQNRNRAMYYGFEEDDMSSWVTCVRDASWHPTAPVIAATSWNGYGMQTGTCTVHSWTDNAEEDEGLPKMGTRINERLIHDDQYYQTDQTTARTLRPRRS